MRYLTFEAQLLHSALRHLPHPISPCSYPLMSVKVLHISCACYLQKKTKAITEEVPSRTDSIRTAYSSIQSSNSASLGLPRHSSSDAAVPSTTQLEPLDCKYLPPLSLQSEASFTLIAPSFSYATSATSAEDASNITGGRATPASCTADAGKVKSGCGVDLEEVDPEMFVIKDLDSGRHYDILQAGYICIAH